MKTGTDRRAFLSGAGRSASVLALSPLLASMGAATAAAAPAAGKFDFDTPYNRIGTDCVKWDQAIRDEHMPKIVAGMGIADMDFECAPWSRRRCKSASATTIGATRCSTSI